MTRQGASGHEGWNQGHDPAQLAYVRARYGTGEHFILCVGDLQPRKNLGTLIAAYVRLRRAGATQHKLVLVGRKAWLYDGIFDVVRASRYVDEVVFTGHVPAADLVSKGSGLMATPISRRRFLAQSALAAGAAVGAGALLDPLLKRHLKILIEGGGSIEGTAA